MIQPDISKDLFFAEELVCYQNRTGYRFSIDSFLLSHFVMEWTDVKLLDLGSGCGIMGLILLYRKKDETIHYTGVEFQPSLFKLMELNRDSNNFQEKMQCVHGDFRAKLSGMREESFSHVICNPPFYSLGSGRTSTNEEAFLARHQVIASLTDVCSTIFFYLKNKGRAAIIYPASLLSELLRNLENQKLTPKRIRAVYSYPEAQTASLIMVECVKNGGVGLKLLPPLNIYTRKNGDFTEEIEKMYLGNQNSQCYDRKSYQFSCPGG